MDIIARLKHTSMIWHDWNGGHRLGGLISGVFFRRRPNHDYVSDVLTPGDVMALKDHTAVVLETVTNVDMPLAPMGEPNQAELDRVFEESLRAPATPEVTAIEAVMESPPPPVPDPPPPPPTPPRTSYEAQRTGRYAAQQRFPNKGRR